MARSTVAVRFTGQTADLQRAIGTVNGGLGRLSGTIGKVGGILGGAFVADKVFSFGAAAVGEAEEAQRVTKDTAAVLKSMGVEADGAADRIANLAEKQSLKTGTDDELIQSAQNVLLTFSSMADSVENGTDLMERSSMVAQDMAARLGGDMSSAAMTVGKALNDPVRGLTALRRSGIQFTKQQEEQIKAMVAGGDVAGAQAIMLGELERQFKGSAEAQATSTDKAKVAWANLQEQLGNKLLPVVNAVATWLSTHLPTAMARAEVAFQAIQPKIQQVVDFVKAHWPEISAAISSAMETIRAVVRGVLTVVQTLWANFGNNILSFVRRTWPAIRQTISGALEVIRGVIKVVTSLIKGDWSGVWEGIKNIVHGAFNVIVGRVKQSIELIRFVLGVGLEIIGSIFKGAWNGITSWFSSIPGKMRSTASAIWEGLKAGLAAVIDWIRGQLDRLLGPLDEIAGKVGGVVGKLGGVIGKIPGFAKGVTNFGGGLAVVGEDGPELVNLPGGSDVIPMRGRVGGATLAGAGGGNVYNITVNVGPTSDKGAVGQAIVEAIAAYERRNGKGWRR